MLDPAVRQAQEFGVKRFVYEHPDSHLKADVFFDELVMAHTIPFKGRLELEATAITVTDLLLTKLQIHEFTDNDLIDCLVLLAEHETGTTIDVAYIAEIMRKDWGFCHTTEINLGRSPVRCPPSPRFPTRPRAPSSATSRSSATPSSVRQRHRSGSSGPGWESDLAGMSRWKRSTASR